MEEMRFEKGEEVVLLTKASKPEHYLIALKPKILGAKKSDLQLPEGYEKVGLRWRAHLSTLEEYALRLVFEWDWKQVEFDPKIKYSQEAKTYKPKPLAQDGKIYNYMGQPMGDPYHTSGGYHVEHEHSDWQHTHWAMAKHPAYSLKEMAQAVSEYDSSINTFLSNLQANYGINAQLVQMSDPWEMILKLEKYVVISGSNIKKGYPIPYGPDSMVAIKKAVKDFLNMASNIELQSYDQIFPKFKF